MQLRIQHLLVITIALQTNFRAGPRWFAIPHHMGLVILLAQATQSNTAYYKRIANQVHNHIIWAYSDRVEIADVLGTYATPENWSYKVHESKRWALHTQQLCAIILWIFAIGKQSIANLFGQRGASSTQAARPRSVANYSKSTYRRSELSRHSKLGRVKQGVLVLVARFTRIKRNC